MEGSHARGQTKKLCCLIKQTSCEYPMAPIRVMMLLSSILIPCLPLLLSNLTHHIHVQCAHCSCLRLKKGNDDRPHALRFVMHVHPGLLALASSLRASKGKSMRIIFDIQSLSVSFLLHHPFSEWM
jgi:hypothetical protein